jgi:hypothetical protein
MPPLARDAQALRGLRVDWPASLFPYGNMCRPDLWPSTHGRMATPERRCRAGDVNELPVHVSARTTDMSASKPRVRSRGLPSHSTERRFPRKTLIAALDDQHGRASKGGTALEEDPSGWSTTEGWNRGRETGFWFRSPSLRTGQAVFPHPALQSVGSFQRQTR